MSNFETWWEREGQEFLYALNTTTDDDIKLVAEVAWKNGAYCAEQAEQDHKCKDHPDAPHGFCRDESITQDRYVCECEFWDPPKTAEQEPVYISEHCFRNGCACHYSTEVDGVPVTVYAAPVRTKDLTDDEILDAFYSCGFGAIVVDGCRAVISADREKNRG